MLAAMIDWHHMKICDLDKSLTENKYNTIVSMDYYILLYYIYYIIILLYTVRYIEYKKIHYKIKIIIVHIYILYIS